MPITQEEHSRPSKRRMMNKDDVFDFLSLGTTTLAAADGPTFGLRTTAVLANQIIAIIQEMRANKAEARELVDRLKEYISAITEFEPKKSSRTFASLIASMNQSLNEVLHIVAKVKARSGFVRLVYVKKDRRSLEKAKSRLQYAFSHFDLMSSISAAYDAKEIREDVSDISGHLVAAGADASTNIVKIGNYINAMSFTVQNMSLDVKKIAFLVMVLALWTTQSQIPQDTSHGNRKIRVRAHQNARNLDRMGSIKVPLISSLWFKPMNRGMTEGQKTLTAQECRIINITQVGLLRGDAPSCNIALGRLSNQCVRREWTMFLPPGCYMLFLLLMFLGSLATLTRLPQWIGRWVLAVPCTDRSPPCPILRTTFIVIPSSRPM